LGHSEITKSVQDEILPLGKNCFRHESTLRHSLTRLDGLWASSRAGLRGGDARELLKAREAAALIASGRWIYEAALSRTETRGLHRRIDHRESDPSQLHRIRVGGFDQVWTDTAPIADTSMHKSAEHKQPAGAAS